MGVRVWKLWRSGEDGRYCSFNSGGHNSTNTSVIHLFHLTSISSTFLNKGASSSCLWGRDQSIYFISCPQQTIHSENNKKQTSLYCQLTIHFGNLRLNAINVWLSVVFGNFSALWSFNCDCLFSIWHSESTLSGQPQMDQRGLSNETGA